VLAGAATVSPTFTPDVDGAYVISLIVNDGAVGSIPDTVVVTRQPKIQHRPQMPDLIRISARIHLSHLTAAEAATLMETR